MKACNSTHTSNASLTAALPHPQPLYGPAWQRQVPVCLLPPELWLQHTPSPRPQSHWAAQRLAQLEFLHTYMNSCAFPFCTQQALACSNSDTCTCGHSRTIACTHAHRTEKQAPARIVRHCNYALEAGACVSYSSFAPCLQLQLHIYNSNAHVQCKINSSMTLKVTFQSMQKFGQGVHCITVQPYAV